MYGAWPEYTSDLSDEELIKELDLHFTGKYIICLDCHGEKYKSKIGSFTQDDLDEWYGDDWDERDEFVENYKKRGGPYDEVCPSCKGEGLLTMEALREYLVAKEMEAERRAEERYCGNYGY